MTDIEKTQGPEAEIRKIVAFMDAAGSSFDASANGEARRLAVCILALVEDTKTLPSLLGRLGLKDISFYDSSPDYNPELGLPLCGLTLVTLGAKTMNYVPRFNRNTNIKAVSFDSWWNKPVIVDTEKEINLTRRDIVYAVAASNVGTTNTGLLAAYEEITSKVPFGQVTSSSINSDMVQPFFASVRQISYELLGSIRDRAPQYFAPLH
ncbi:MAG: hypothetical protein ACE5GY_09105 [Thermodesulfobacteriota bacterium]